MSLKLGSPTDPNKAKNAKNLEEIASSLKKPHWTAVPMFWMTLAILLLTIFMAAYQYLGVNQSNRAVGSVEPEENSSRKVETK